VILYSHFEAERSWRHLIDPKIWRPDFLLIFFRTGGRLSSYLYPSGHWLFTGVGRADISWCSSGEI